MLPEQKYRDIEKLPVNPDCINIIDNETLVTYLGGNKTEYKLLSDKYEETYTTTGTPPPEYKCYNIQDIKIIKTSYDYMTPLYVHMAIFSFVLIVFICFYIFVKPFFRTKV